MRFRAEKVVGHLGSAPPASGLPSTGSPASRSGLSRGAFVRSLAVLACLTAIVRVAALADFVRSNPVARVPDGDAAVYWETAERIAGGQWIDEQPFLSAPLFPYLLGVVRLLGGGLTVVYILQLVAHLATMLLLARLTAGKFGNTTGIVAAAVFALAMEPAFYATRLLPTTLQLLLVTVVLGSAQGFRARPGLWGVASLGLLTGILALAYPPAMVIVALLVPWAAGVRRDAESAANGELRPAPAGARRYPLRHNRNVVGIAYGAIAAGFALIAIAPATWHNWRACGEFVPITAHAGVTFSQGNAPGSSGTYTALPGVSAAREKMHVDAARVYALASGQPGTYAQINRYFFMKGLTYLSGDLRRSCVLILKKLYWFAAGRHYGDIYFPTLEQREGWIHLLPLAPVQTPWLIGPALWGMLALRRKGVFNGFDQAMFLVPLVVVAAFWYSPRYRLPAVPVVVTASAIAVVDGCRRLRRDVADSNCSLTAPASGGRASFVVLIGAAALSLSTGPINAAIGFDRASDYQAQYECNRGHVYARSGDYESALEHFILCDRLLPDQPAVLVPLAEAYGRLARFAEAERVCRRLGEVDPHSPESWLVWGGLHLRRGQWPEAMKAFEQCLVHDPTSADGHWGMWQALSASGDKEAAIAHLKKVVELDPYNAPAASEYGIFLAQNGDFAEAERYLRRAVKLAPRQAQTHFNLAIMLRDSGRTAEAYSSLKKALRLDPSYLKAEQALTELESRPAGAVNADGQIRQAERQAPSPAADIRELERLIEVHPSNPLHYSHLAGALYARGQVRRAVAVLQDGAKRADGAGTIRVELAWLLATAPDDEVRNGARAVTIVRDVLATTQAPPPEYLDVLAAALAETGQFERAYQEADRARAIAERQGRKQLAEAIRARTELYRSGKTYRQ